MSGDVVPFYFGDPGRELYGVFHPSRDRPTGAVLIVPPVGHEYVRLHRAMRQVATQCHRAGFAALRFDLTGCGDSTGSLDVATLQGWVDDGRRALAELRARSGPAETWIVGIRLGAVIGACAAAAEGGVSGVVLWDPMVDGREFWTEQRALHRRMVRHSHLRPRDRRNAGGEEILGFRWPDALVRQVEQLSPASVLARPADRVMIVESRLDVTQQAMVTRLTALGCVVHRRRLEALELWGWEEDLDKVHVPHRLIREIVGWLRNPTEDQ